MPGGHASHKGTSDKPNVNSPSVIAEAADKTLEPNDLLREEVTNNAASRAKEFVDYPPALQRPNKESNISNEED